MARPKEFNREEVLDKAVELFWYQGYEATSIQALLGSMGINRGSLYDTFGDKHSLFLEALDRYSHNTTQRLKCLEESCGGLAAIRQFFWDLLDSLLSGDTCKGCLMANSIVEVALHDPQAREKVSAHLARLEAAFHRALVRASEAEEIDPQERDLQALARFLTSSANGLCVVAKAVANRATLEDIVMVTLSVLGQS